MKKLLLILSLALFSSTILAKPGDTYICSMKKHVVISPNEIHHKPLELFIFELTENEITFPMNTGYFKIAFEDYLSYQITDYREYKSGEYFAAIGVSTRNRIVFDDGYLNFSHLEGSIAKIVIAKCDIQ